MVITPPSHQSGLNNTVLIIRAKDPSKLTNGILIAEMLPEYLWGDPNTFALDMTICITNEHFEQLFCTSPIQANSIRQALETTNDGVKGKFIWEDNHGQYFANYHEIFLQAKFLTPHWIVVATQHEDIALGSMKNLNTIFWGSAVFAVLIIMLFSMIQIRRVLVPLEKLIEGTNRLKNQNFTTPVEVISSDEFGELATSFNAMGARLGDQFSTLSALSRIDREILSGLNINKVASEVLAYLQQTIKTDSANITVFDHASPNKTIVHKLNNDNKHVSVSNKILPENTRQKLFLHPNGFWRKNKIASHTKENLASTPIPPYWFMLPLNWKDQLVGFLSLGFNIPTNWQKEDMVRIKDYADRVAVALFTKNREELLLRQARIDALTNLPNRFLFSEQLQKDAAQKQRTNGKLAVMYIDLDRFKKINDSLGHTIGDKLLCEAGNRLSNCVRGSDTVARLGGDEFAIIINEVDSEHQINTIAKHICTVLTTPFKLEEEEHIIAASIGIAIYPQDGTTITDLMRNSDIAMYRAKDKGGNQHIFFEESMNAEVIKRTTIERELRTAIAEQQFVLHYQPQVDPKTSQVRGVETLVRWNHPKRGLISPADFIGIAEDTGLIAEIGYIILTEACAQYRVWINQGMHLDHIAVNVSVRQFRQPNFFQSVETVLKDNAMPARSLELEITESVLMDDTEIVLGMLHQLQGLGVQLSIDDFGTGYSSMSYLEQLPFDILKIDMSFVSKIQDHGEGGTIAATIIAMAHALNKSVVAEGVETQAQLDFLAQHDCELIQGYYFSRPLPANEFVTYIQSLTHHKKLVDI